MKNRVSIATALITGFYAFCNVALAVEILISQDDMTAKARPVIDANGNSVVVVWESSGQDGDGAGVFARRLNAAGEPLGPELQVNTHTAGDQEDPDVTVRPDGSFVVVWSGSGPGDNGGVFARLFTADGTPVGPETIVNTTTDLPQDHARVASDDEGDFVVVWSSSSDAGGYWEEEPYLRLFNHDGTPVGGEEAVTSSFNIWNVDIAMNGPGEFVVVWTEEEDDWPWHEGRLYDATGTPINTPFFIDGAPETYSGASAPRADILDDGSFAVTWWWTDETAKLRTYDETAVQTAEGQVDTGELAIVPDVTFVEKNVLAVVWKPWGINRVRSNRFDTDCAPLGDRTTVGPTDSWETSIATARFGEIIAYRRDQSVYVWLPFAGHLRDGVPIDRSLADRSAWYRLDIPTCAQSLTTALTHLSGNLDLAVRRLHPPSSTVADCRSANPGTDAEVCTLSSPEAGSWWVAAETATGNPPGSAIDYTLTATFAGCEGDPPVSRWSGDGHTLDVVGSNHGVPEGGLAFAAGMVAQGFDLDGVDSAVRVPHDPSLDVGDGDFATSVWVRTAVADRQVILDTRTTGPAAGFSLVLDNGRPKIELADGSAARIIECERFVADDELHFLALSVDRETPNGGLLVVDGRSALVFDPSDVPDAIVSAEDLVIGRQTTAAGGGQYFTGILDEVTLFERALALRETVDALGALVAWWPAERTPFDLAGPFHGMLEGGAAFTQGRYGSGFALDGVDAALRVSNGPDFDLGAGDFSAAFWARCFDETGRNVVLDTRTSPPTGIQVYVLDGRPGIQLADGTATSFTSNTDIADGALHFVAITVDRDSTTGGTFWIDGQSVGLFDPSGHPGSLTTSGEPSIGRRTSETGGGRYFTGVLDDLMVFDRVLTENELAWLYASDGLLMVDGFESGDTTGWSAQSP